jgi:hypothetical protein
MCEEMLATGLKDLHLPSCPVYGYSAGAVVCVWGGGGRGRERDMDEKGAVSSAWVLGVRGSVCVWGGGAWPVLGCIYERSVSMFFKHSRWQITCAW